MSIKIPPAFDKTVYRDLNDDLRNLSDSELVDHYNKYGKSEGRVSNSIKDRKAFASIITPGLRALEIGPFTSPLLCGDNVAYCDVLNEDQLRERARSLGLDPGGVPPIHFQLGKNFLDEICETFDAIFSSHVIEHQPDLVTHLNQVQSRLASGGRYFAIIPDKRYCFDKQIAPSTIADVILAYEEKRTAHNIKSVIEHKALTVHNEAQAHWEGRNDPKYEPVNYDRVKEAIDEFRGANGRYIDVHAWYFTPDSFACLIGGLNKLGLVALELERLYRTRYGSNEFWVILYKGERELPDEELGTWVAERDELSVQRDALAAERDALIKSSQCGFQGD